MKIVLAVIGKTDIGFVKEGVQYYAARIGNYIKFEILELPNIKNAGKMPPAVLAQKEGEMLEQYIAKYDKVVLLDEKGSSLASRKFAAQIERDMVGSVDSLCFVIGGAFGFSDDIRKKVRNTLSVSEMTFSHQLIRIIFLEQLYRAFTIIRNEPYHND